MEQTHQYDDENIGEGFSEDMRRPLARHANKILGSLKTDRTVIYLGEEHGDVNVNNVRFRDALQEGNLRAYIRQEATDPKVIIPSVIALGVVATGIYKLKHRNK